MTLDEDLRRALATLAFVAASAAPARALPAGLRWSGWPDPATDSVSPGGDKADVAYSLANGYPLWIEDANGVRLELCLDLIHPIEEKSFELEAVVRRRDVGPPPGVGLEFVNMSPERRQELNEFVYSSMTEVEVEVVNEADPNLE